MIPAVNGDHKCADLQKSCTSTKSYRVLRTKLYFSVLWLQFNTETLYKHKYTNLLCDSDFWILKLV